MTKLMSMKEKITMAKSELAKMLAAAKLEQLLLRETKKMTRDQHKAAVALRRQAAAEKKAQRFDQRQARAEALLQKKVLREQKQAARLIKRQEYLAKLAEKQTQRMARIAKMEQLANAKHAQNLARIAKMKHAATKVL